MTARHSKPKPPTGPQLQLLNFVEKRPLRKVGGGFWCCDPGVEYQVYRASPPDLVTWWNTSTVKACIRRGWLGVHPEEPTPRNPEHTAMRYTLTPSGREVLAAHQHTLEKI